ncbi:secretin and TonB N-terminal domain-containing protein [Pseudomonas sp. JQ170]|uniref:secretin N-terminal domain-containing protein n=1 Tax=unclassified Pseudomonas TaxID=196821 RepID=UPI00265269DB|nr:MULTISPECIES: secretin N-terminal domain-containing protein [unclassified Pseudomonas]MDN7140006.1 secretin and TonB N-terminal domain-containing protein [Pseudomonas sp. JQ170]WRO78632.1 secretin N-terminal domain-containing protein [Pseudomonas sp. 170C]
MNSSRLCNKAPFLMLALCVALAGCGTTAARKDGQALINEGQYEAGIARLEEALKEDPRDTELNIALMQGRKQSVEELLAKADSDRSHHDFAGARMGYGRVLTLEPNNRRAQDAVRQIEQMRNLGERVALGQAALRSGDLFGAERHMREVLQLDPQNEAGLALRKDIELVQSRTAQPNPQLQTKLEKPVTLEFRDANLKTIFEVLSQVAGLNFIFDKDLRPDMKATIFVRDVRIEDAVSLLLEQNQLHQKVVNENTLLIYPDSPQKTKDYQELVMRTFYLTSIDSNTALNMVKTMLKTRDVFVDERLNTLTMRDTPDAVRMAEKLLQSQDQSNPEVVLEVEVMEVARSRILELGLQWPNTFGILNNDGNPVSTIDQLRGINSERITFSPSPQAKINAQDNDINTLASPVIRVSNREQARIHIGQRVPIISATSVPSTQGPVITESVTYLDVGLKLEVTPVVHLNNEVAIKISLEVSNAKPLEPTRQGTIPVQVDTRNAQTSLRLHDGETQVLAGLVRNDEGASGNKIPGLGDIPGLGRLFGSNRNDKSQSELVLSITPRIVRNLPYQSPSDMEFPTGTETSMQIRNLNRSIDVDVETEQPIAAVPTGVRP